MATVDEKRLVDVNEALRQLRNSLADDPTSGSAGWRLAHNVIIDILHNLPIEDAVGVVHGRWIDDYDTFVQDNGTESEPIHTGFVCSVCGRHSFAIEPYCHCGAKMERGTDDGQ